MAFKPRPNRKETDNRTIRFPLPVIEQINNAIAGKDISFSKFVIQACEYALSEMEENKT